MTDVQSESAQAETLPGEGGPGASPPSDTAAATPAGSDGLVAGGLVPERLLTREKTTRVVAARVSVWGRLASLWHSRELFAFLVRKEIKVRYKNSFLGFLWSMLNPALNLTVFYVLFTYFLPNGIRWFVIYMFAAMLVWNLFSTAVLSATSTIVANGGIVKKVAFPREILAFASVGSA
ncbi:MAG TPA: ABC transporter permease, partial [Acidimicrobiales bacterium]|nr:ABC transporter permease [Acidimicrobiales bacterium]